MSTALASPTWRDLPRFALVGLSGYGVNLVVFALCTDAGGSHRAAAVAAFLVAVCSNFIWNRRWTFRGAREQRARGQALRFLVVSVGAFLIALGGLEALVAAGLAPLAAQAIAVIVVTPLSYAGNRRWSFGT